MEAKPTGILLMSEIIVLFVLAAIFVGLGGETKEDDMRCLMTEGNECILKASNDYPEPYTQQCVTPPGQGNNSSMCIFGDSDEEHVLFYRTKWNRSVRTGTSLQTINSTNTSVTVSDLFYKVENNTFNASEEYSQLRKLVGNVTVHRTP